MSEGKIYAAIAAIIAELGAIGKDKKNPQQGFMYRGIDQFYNALHPLFAKYGVFTAPEIVNRIDQPYQTKGGATWNRVVLTVKYTFYASDGSNFAAVVDGEGVDAGDKATSKALAIAHKYVLMQVFCVSTEDTIDPDSEVAPEQDAQQKQAKITKPVKTPNNPKTDAEQAQRFEKARSYFLSKNPEVWAKICSEQKIDDEVPACMLDSATLQNVLDAATAALGNGEKGAVQ